MFIAREPVLENSFCKHDSAQTSTLSAASPIVCQQGCVVTIAGCDGETTVVRKMTSCDDVPFGFLMQEVRTAYDREYIPWGGIPSRDVGTQRELVGGPVGVAHLGIYSTNVYDTDVAIHAGDFLYASASGTLVTVSGWGYCTSSGWAKDNPVATAMNSLTAAQLVQGPISSRQALDIIGYRRCD